MDTEAKIKRLTEAVADLEARRAASEAVFSSMLGLLLHLHPMSTQLLAAMRTCFTISAKAADAASPTAKSDEQVMQLKAEQYVQDIVDQIERTATMSLP